MLNTPLFLFYLILVLILFSPREENDARCPFIRVGGISHFIYAFFVYTHFQTPYRNILATVRIYYALKIHTAGSRDRDIVRTDNFNAI